MCLQVEPFAPILRCERKMLDYGRAAATTAQTAVLSIDTVACRTIPGSAASSSQPQGCLPDAASPAYLILQESSILAKLGFEHPAAAAPATAPGPQASGAPAAAAAPGGAATPAPAAIPVVDVVAHLDALAAKNPEKLNWKVSIVDLLKLLGLDSSLASRKGLAAELNCPADKLGDSAQMNIWLHKTVLQKLADNGGNVPQDLLK
jgi:hypothetical protein